MNLKNIFEKGEKDLSLVKVTIAGIFMGMANLVPGISGGTMVLAMGLYEEFIESLSNISRFKFTKKNVLFFINLFAVLFFTTALIIGNSRKGLIVALTLTIFTLFRLFGIGNILNFLLLVGLGIIIESYAKFTKRNN